MSLDADVVDLRIDAAWVVGSLGGEHVLILDGTIEIQGDTVTRTSDPAA